MSQCQGVNIFESGDYLVDERQGHLCSTIERLRVHMAILKQKLQEEKMLLSELKAETQYLTKQHTVKPCIPEDYNLNSYCGKSEVSLREPSPTCKVVYTGDQVKNKPKLIVEPKQNLDIAEYVKRLNEIDSLCKEEMARVNNVVEQMEPLRQIASDWTLESRLSEMSAIPVSGAVGPARELGAAKHNHTLSGIEPAAYSSPANPGEFIVISPERPVPQASAIMPESKHVTQSGDSAHKQAPVESSKSKQELRKTYGQLKLDYMKTTPQNNTTIDRKDQVAKRKKEKKPKTSSSEVSLSSLEALGEKSITLVDVKDNIGEDGDTKESEKKAELDRLDKSEHASKSAISLESIERAFANHHKRKGKKGDANDETDASRLLDTTHKGKDKEQREQDKLLACLHPNAQKIVKNWVIVDTEKAKGSTDKKPERCSKKRVLNLGRQKADEHSLCQDDVINKFLYDEERYVYAPLFVSEPEDE